MFSGVFGPDGSDGSGEGESAVLVIALEIPVVAGEFTELVQVFTRAFGNPSGGYLGGAKRFSGSPVGIFCVCHFDGDAVFL